MNVTDNQLFYHFSNQLGYNEKVVINVSFFVGKLVHLHMVEL